MIKLTNTAKETGSTIIELITRVMGKGRTNKKVITIEETSTAS